MFVSNLKLKENPKVNSNLLSRLTFHYLNPLLSLGSSRPLVEEDLWEPTPNNRAALICQPAEKTWKEQLKKKSPSFAWALITANKHWILQQVILQCLLVGMRILMPIMLGYFIDWFSDPNSDELPKIMNPDVDGYLWATFYSILRPWLKKISFDLYLGLVRLGYYVRDRIQQFQR